jgi:hypothetical protein
MKSFRLSSISYQFLINMEAIKNAKYVLKEATRRCLLQIPSRRERGGKFGRWCCRLDVGTS